jgi:NhaP-type Na+/H+ or K+/H+ antiporter
VGGTFQWSALISIVVIVALGLVAYRVLQRQRKAGAI